MEFKEALNQILYLVITGILPVLVVYIVSYLKIKIKENTEKLNNEQLEKYITAATDAISKAVTAINQTYVDTLKQSGEFTKEAQEKAKNMAIEKAKELITEESKKAIEILYNDFETYLDNAIESMVRENKITVA